MADNILGNMPNEHAKDDPTRTYEVVVAATREMGIGKDGKLPWNLPSSECQIQCNGQATNGDSCKDNIEIQQFSFLPKMIFEHHEEYTYIRLVEDIISHGAMKSDRTGTSTLSKPYCEMQFNLRRSYPLLTTKRVFWQAVVKELLCFTSGSTNVKVRQTQGLYTWDGNASRDYLDSVGLAHRKEGDLSPVFGFQWRHFGSKYVDMRMDYTGKGVDQMSDVIDMIKKNPYSRRIILAACCPFDLKEMAVTPCEIFLQFYVNNGELSCETYEQCADMGLRVPINIAFYSLLICMIAQVCDLVPGDFTYTIGEAHICRTHVRPLREQLQRQPRPFPILKINHEKKDIDSFIESDFTIVGYHPHPKIDMKMAV